MTDAAAIAFQSVTVIYDGAAKPAVDNVSLRIAKGEFVALVGTSGSGKTSLLKTINRLHDPAAGAVQIDGGDIATVDAVQLRRRIGYVFQGIGLFPHLSVAENIAITPKLLGWSRQQQSGRVRELLDLVELPQEFSDRFPAQLSGGQQQRIGIARALAARPDILLMDEPFGALDPVTRDNLGSACRQIHERLGLTTIIVTHDMQEAMLLADRIIVMRDGLVAADGPPADLMSKPGDDDVAALFDVPRRQAEKLSALAARARGAGPHA